MSYGINKLLYTLTLYNLGKCWAVKVCKQSWQYHWSHQLIREVRNIKLQNVEWQRRNLWGYIASVGLGLLLVNRTNSQEKELDIEQSRARTSCNPLASLCLSSYSAIAYLHRIVAATLISHENSSFGKE